METKNYKSVNKPIKKKDSFQLLLGRPLYTDDITPQNALVVKLLRSKYPNAIVEDIDTSYAKKVPGIVDIFTWEDVPENRFTIAGQVYPEPSAYDRLIIDRHVRYKGDVVAIIAAENEKSALKAMKLIKVKYNILEPVLDFRKAKDSSIIIHPEDEWFTNFEVGGDNKRNLVASGSCSNGDIESVMKDCDIVIERKYHTKSFNQTPMETFRTYAELDAYGRIHVISSTQIAFHCRRIIATALGIPKSMVRVEKPRIGGGFGTKQTAVSEVYPAFVTYKTGRPSKLIYTREESMIAGSPRHEMELTVKLGANKDGKIRAIDLYTLSNTGAYSEHGSTTVELSYNKSITLYSGSIEAYRFNYDVVYTNQQSAGAYRGFGATQGIFAVETAVNELAEKLNIDPTVIRDMNMVKEGNIMPSYCFETASACSLDRCMESCRQMFGWEEKYPIRDMGNGKIRASGVAIAMQASGIPNIDVGSATVKLNEDGKYTLLISAADMGTGCDTILSQILAECLECDVDDISVFGPDTDATPYDTGSYASSTTYITGKAVEEAGIKIRKHILEIASGILDCQPEKLIFDGKNITREDNGESLTIKDIASKFNAPDNIPIEATASHSSPTSPPPYMVGMAEIELDKLTGVVTVLNYSAVIDCGTVINPVLARVQAEGGIVQGIGHTLYENITRDKDGVPMENSLMQYKIPTRLDINNITVSFESSYEESGPFGAKSIGEIVINTPAPAIVHAIYRATGTWYRTIPVTPEQIIFGSKSKDEAL